MLDVERTTNKDGNRPIISQCSSGWCIMKLRENLGVYANKYRDHAHCCSI